MTLLKMSQKAMPAKEEWSTERKQQPNLGEGWRRISGSWFSFTYRRRSTARHSRRFNRTRHRRSGCGRDDARGCDAGGGDAEGDADGVADLLREGQGD